MIHIEESNSHTRFQTDAGIKISINPLASTALVSIRVNLDPDSLFSEVSDPHRRKQPSDKISTTCIGSF
jgi:hypothetical protein